MFVDDPVLTVRGTRPARAYIMLRTVVVWLVLGFLLSWKKGQKGERYEWIGAMFSKMEITRGSPWRASRNFRRTCREASQPVRKPEGARRPRAAQRLAATGRAISLVGHPDAPTQALYGEAMGRNVLYQRTDRAREPSEASQTLVAYVRKCQLPEDRTPCKEASGLLNSSDLRRLTIGRRRNLTGRCAVPRKR